MSKKNRTIIYTRWHLFFILIATAASLGGGAAFVRIHSSTRQKQAVQQKLSDSQSSHTVADAGHAPNHPLYQSPETLNAHRKVPILMYHYIRIVTDSRDRLGFNLSVTPTNFDAQMQWLSSHDYHTYPLTDFCDGKVPESGKPVILTFDDGYDDAYTEALPMLQKYHLMGTFFIVSGFINQPRYMTGEQLKALEAAGMEMGAHTIKHIDLATATLARQKEEIEGSKQSAPVFAYPAGQYTNDTIQLVKKAGYKCAVTTHYGIATEFSPLYELPRVRVSGGEDLVSFADRVEGRK